MDRPSTVCTDELVHLFIRGCHKAILVLILFLDQVDRWLEIVTFKKISIELQGGHLLVWNDLVLEQHDIHHVLVF